MKPALLSHNLLLSYACIVFYFTIWNKKKLTVCIQHKDIDSLPFSDLPEWPTLLEKVVFKATSKRLSGDLVKQLTIIFYKKKSCNQMIAHRNKQQQNNKICVISLKMHRFVSEEDGKAFEIVER